MKKTLRETSTNTKEYEVSDFKSHEEIRAQFHLKYDKRLKACPFCGGRAFLNVTYLLDFIQVVCSCCFCQTEPKPTVEESIKLWNARAKKRGKSSGTEESQESETGAVRV